MSVSCAQRAHVCVTPDDVLGDAETLVVHLELLDREETTSQPRMHNSAKLWCRACGRGLEAAASLVRRAKVWVTPQTCDRRCGHVAVTTIDLQYGGNHVPAPRRFDFWCWMRFQDRGLRLLAAHNGGQWCG